MNYTYLNDFITYNTFDKMDTLLTRMHTIVSQHTPALNDTYISLIIRASTLSKNSTLFHYFDEKGDNSVLRKSDMQFISEGFNLVYYLLNNKRYSISRLKLNRGMFKSIFEGYYDLLHRYMVASDAHSYIRQNINKDNVARLSIYKGEMDEVLQLSKVKEEDIYGLCNQLKYFLTAYNKLYNKIHRSYLRVVFKEALKIVKSRIDSFPDAFQNGTPGLDRAIEYFDTNKGYSFQTYASHWIKKVILECSESEASFLPISNSVWRKYNKFTKSKNKNHSTIPDNEFIAKDLGIKVSKVDKVLDAINKRKVVMLDAPISDNDDNRNTVMDTIKQDKFSVEKQESLIPKGYINSDNKKFIHLLFGVNVDNIPKIIESRIRDEKVCQLLHLKEVSDAKVTK